MSRLELENVKEELPELVVALVTMKMYQHVIRKHVHRGLIGNHGLHVLQLVVVEYKDEHVIAPMEHLAIHVLAMHQKKDHVKLMPVQDGVTGPNGLTVVLNAAVEPEPPVEAASTATKVNLTILYTVSYCRLRTTRLLRFGRLHSEL